MRPAHQPRIVIAPGASEFSTWMGGANYLRNLVELLACARSEGLETPWLALYSNDRSAELFLDLMNSPAIGFTVGNEGAVQDVKPAFIEACGLDPSALDQNALLSAMENCFAGAVSFPITYTHFPADVPKPIYWIPDFQHKTLPHYFPKDELAFRDRMFSSIAASEVDLLMSSQAALDDFRRFYPNASSRCHVWRFVSLLDRAAESGPPAESVSNKFDLPQRFFYIANQFWAHKDHLTAFRALRKVRNDGVPVELVCTGASHDCRDPAYSRALEQAVADAGLSAHIRMLGLIPREDQIGIFRSATAVLQPSQFEGWSTVVEDARTLGRPVLLSDLPVHREQMPDNPYFFRTGDSQDLARLMATAWADLPTGPDPERERQAAAAMTERRRQAAQAFTDIVRTVAQS